MYLENVFLSSHALKISWLKLHQDLIRSGFKRNSDAAHKVRKQILYLAHFKFIGMEPISFFVSVLKKRIVSVGHRFFGIYMSLLRWKLLANAKQNMFAPWILLPVWERGYWPRFLVTERLGSSKPFLLESNVLRIKCNLVFFVFSV